MVCATAARAILFVVRRRPEQKKKNNFIELSNIGVNENGFLHYLDEKPQHAH